MNLTRCEVDTTNIQNLPDTPAIGPDELKQKFDKTGKDIKEYLNQKLLPEIEKESKKDKDEVIGKILKTFKYDVTLQTNIEENTDYTIPSTYKVNTSNLDVYFEGCLLNINEHYTERGTGDSDKIRFDWDVPKGSKLSFVIRK